MELQTIRSRTVSRSADRQATEPTLSKDELFEILKNQRRRDALSFLKENGGEVNLSDMSEFIAAKENGIDVSALSSSQRKRVYIGLYQCHLPKMANFGVVDFDKDRGTIELLPAAELLDPYLDDDVVASDPNVELRMGAAATVALLVIAGLVGAPVLSALPAAGWAVVSTVALLLFAVTEAVGV
ncbi:hypothetical protein SAMN04487948_101194 [Halogranum amylolyticum]|uniref:DUF7344 domain-containing protein n=1 Tax=Halogranum amylolyticum TaxID=660520 RepID=A0A1H8MZ55_9EURY|nr:hypothetical protein [Halogranum amylolyticum]SEO22543.1 hypothetical protein SAMN04487948_101194 [Halogranum amylolyticum]